MQVSRMAGSLIGSEIIKIGNEVNDMIRKGEQICNLTIGDFDPTIYPIPAELKDEITRAYEAGQTNYPPANGMAALREAAAAFTRSRLGLEYSAADFLVAGGSRPLIYATYLALIDPGDKVVFPVPSWNNNHYCHLSGAEAVMVETRPENNFMPTAEELAPHLAGATMLALCSPLNPTGTVFSREDLEAICDLVLAENERREPGEKPLYLLYDQIYWLLTFGETAHYDPVNLRPALRDYTIYIDGISKCLAATGVRVGYAFGPAPVIDKMKAILGHVGAWAPKAEQVAVAHYLPATTAVDRYLSTFKHNIQRSLDTLHEGLQTMKSAGLPVDSMVPMGAIYLTARLDVLGRTTPAGQVLTSTKELTSYLISEARLALVPFSAFGTDDTAPWFRMSVGGASLEAIEAALPRLQSALEALR
ncbi:pyridoxal phosphate-dependent aminotransferase [Hymenobacter rubripertinctus]|uniref:Aminotransferase class I/II-fold pyridoxal phosphate-dependent enzyme n=1 Tax=Hymenobacter rubripertinctus TaxID=2029981 RepID=A0A418R0P3_9BACT|nr:aminotransferase class I/II-fold pyridoxal phosphate-dependent enzyme [Hymenobacter rubripertinctus]RIY11006.1 aminotransferase class I/II-fold pyridoxal phosphate-dependent enzyme [Hymenobacter rubripertinctus]